MKTVTVETTIEKPTNEVWKVWTQLDDFKKTKGSVRFPLSKPLPKDLIIQMVEYRLGLLMGNLDH